MKFMVVLPVKSNEDMILALAGQASARIISSFEFKHCTSYNISFILPVKLRKQQQCRS